MSLITIKNGVASVIVTNTSDEHLSATSIFASYHDEKYIASTFSDIELDAQKKTLVKCSLENHTVKCFVWGDLSNLKPLCDFRLSKIILAASCQVV